MNLINVASRVRKLKTFCIEDENKKLVSPLRENKIERKIATDFYTKLRTAYVTAAVYIQKKYALNNSLLKSFRALHPWLRYSSLKHENLVNLKPYFKTLLSSYCGEYSSEIQKYLLIQNYRYQKKKY